MNYIDLVVNVKMWMIQSPKNHMNTYINIEDCECIL